jgi:AcrR family transcriptional regulator
MSRWPSSDAMRQRILETADRLFYGQGIRAVGVDTIAAEIGISKRTLYNYFPSKDALIVAYLSRRLVPLEVSDRPPVEQILGVFDRLTQSAARDGFRGCPFVNAVTELGDPAHAGNKVAIAFKEARRSWFARLLNELDAKQAEALATQLAILLDGAIAATLVRRDPAMIVAAKEAALVLLNASGVQTGVGTRRKPAVRPRRRVS